MKAESGKTVSLWMATGGVPQFQPLDEDMYTEVCVIGAGIAGMTTAYLLAQEGCDVIVVDDNDIGGGETQRTTAHLSNVIDDHFFHVIRCRGVQVARQAFQAHSKAIDLIERIATNEGIDCDFRRLDGYLYADAGQPVRSLRKELDACNKIGFPDIDWLDDLELGSRNGLKAIRFPRQAQFHVLKYLSGLARALRSVGGRIFTRSHVTQVKEGRPGEITVEAAGGTHTIKASWVVAATNAPITDYMKVYLKEAAYRTYAVAARVPAAAVEPALYWDLADPYHYIRTQPIAESNEQWLIIGGEDHRTGQDKDPPDHLSRLRNYSRKLFPQIEAFECQWSGQVLETPDGLALIGRDPEHKGHILMASGDSGMGMTHGTIGGMLLRDMILGLDNQWQDVFAPSRWPLGALGELVAENLSTFKGYTEYAAPVEKVKELSELEAGEGALIQHKGRQIAAYRDLDGRTHQLSPVCPHMKGPLQWNACEQSWDCPAHGSRFSASGEVIDGPARHNMAEIPQDARIDEAAGGTGTEQHLHPPPPESSGGVEPRH